MAKAQVFWNRYQTHRDHLTFSAAGELLKKKLIVARSVDRNHCTIITMDDTSSPVPVNCLKDFNYYFHNAKVVSDIIGKYLPSADGGDDDDEEEVVSDVAGQSTAAPGPVEEMGATNAVGGLGATGTVAHEAMEAEDSAVNATN